MAVNLGPRGIRVNTVAPGYIHTTRWETLSGGESHVLPRLLRGNAPDMKITALRTFICNAYRTNWVFVKVLTDEGLHGVGEATLEHRETTVAEAIRELERTFDGRDPHQIEALWHEAYRDADFRGGPVLRKRLFRRRDGLLGHQRQGAGRARLSVARRQSPRRVPCYANGWFAPAKTPDEFAEKARPPLPPVSRPQVGPVRLGLSGNR